MKTFYWHDYETWGATPSVDRASQFAGVRTDEQLNIVGDPLVIYSQPPADIWPHPEACLVTGITPQKAQAEGLTEREFIARIHAEISQPNTCTAGYNSLRFDDEVTRYTLFRNFYDPYEREWRNGNSRWDIIDMMRLVYALRPEGIEWPMVEGKPSFKLEYLTQANGITHASAHDAYSDVAATIALAKRVKEDKPALYDYVYRHKSKQAVASMIDIPRCKPLLHISSRFPASRGCAGLVAPLAMHPVNKNAVIFYDLSVDPTPMASMSAEEIRERVFVAQEDLPEGVERLPVKLIHLNKCPVLATTKLLDEKNAQRLGIDKAQCEQHWQCLKNMKVGEKLQQMYRLDNFESPNDPEQCLYDGFCSDDDKQLMAELRRLDGKQLVNTRFVFEDARLNGMLLRYRARNFPSSLTPEENAEWREFMLNRLHYGDEKIIGYRELCERIDELKRQHAGEQEASEILSQLARYAEQHLATLDEP